MDMSSLPLMPPPSLSSERSAFMWLAADSSRCSFLSVDQVASSPCALMRYAGDSGQKGNTQSWKTEKTHLFEAGGQVVWVQVSGSGSELGVGGEGQRVGGKGQGQRSGLGLTRIGKCWQAEVDARGRTARGMCSASGLWYRRRRRRAR